MTLTPEAQRTFGLRVIPGGSDLAARVSLDFDQKLFRRNYRRPVLVSAALLSDQADVDRWMSAAAPPHLLGFETPAQRDFFEKLLDVPRFGPRGGSRLLTTGSRS